MQPAALLLGPLQHLPVRVVHAAEIVVMPWHSLGPTSIVVVPSLSGTTSEAITVLEHARAAGATTITLTGYAESPGRPARRPQRHQPRRRRHLLGVLLPAVPAAGAGHPRAPRRIPRLRPRRHRTGHPAQLPAGGQARLRRHRRHPRQRHQGHRLPHHHRRRRLLDPSLVLRHLHPRRNAVDQDTAHPRRRLLPRHPGTARRRHQPAGTQGRRPITAPHRPHRSLGTHGVQTSHRARHRHSPTYPASAPMCAP